MEFVQPIREVAQIEDMKTYFKSKSLRNWALFTLGINSALRISDLLALSVDDVMDSNGNIRERIKVKEIKTRKGKSFPFTAKVKESLDIYIKTEHPTKALFPSRQSGEAHMSRVQFHRAIKEAAEYVGIKENVGSHSMRKSWAYNAYMKGVKLAQIMDALNHSSESMTLRYLGITQDILDEVYMEMDL
ncbi:MAG TPA: tyrosine-type recombinase/integrase [Clostridiaceae bacterium]